MGEGSLEVDVQPGTAGGTCTLRRTANEFLANPVALRRGRHDEVQHKGVAVPFPATFTNPMS